MKVNFIEKRKGNNAMKCVKEIKEVITQKNQERVVKILKSRIMNNSLLFLEGLWHRFF